MYYIALLESGNFVFGLSRILKKKGCPVEVISTPCKLAKDGCGYCLRFHEQYKDTVIKEGAEAGLPVKQIYRITETPYKKVYDKIYP